MLIGVTIKKKAKNRHIRQWEKPNVDQCNDVRKKQAGGQKYEKKLRPAQEKLL